ncbi:MAG: enolase C-terminal domain-like protein [Flavobacteriales bacterium]
MKAEIFTTNLNFKYPFVLASGTRTSTPVLFLRVSFNGKTGWAEAALPPYFGLTSNDVVEKLQTVSLANMFSHFTNATELNEKIRKTYTLPEPVNALLVSAAVNLTENYVVGQGNYQSTLTVSASPGIAMRDLLAEQENFTAIKIKVGSGDEQGFIEYVLKSTDKPFCIDANRGWKNRDKAALFCEWLEKKKCLLLEQPFEASDLESHHWLRSRTSIPVIADESICTYTDLLSSYDAFDGVNIKLLKCGGPVEAKKMMGFSKEKKLKTLIGCMSESSLGCATAARLSHLVDFVDLDGPYLINNDPFSGFLMRNGRIEINENGILPTETFLSAFSARAVTL